MSIASWGLSALCVFTLVGQDATASACVPHFAPVTILTRPEALAACEQGDMMGCRRAKLTIRACAMGDVRSCVRILDDDSFRAHELALSAIRTHCFAGNDWACDRLTYDTRFDAPTKVFATHGRCLIGIAGACQGFPEPKDDDLIQADLEPPTTDIAQCRGEGACLARICYFHGLGCLEACATADPSSCALLEGPSFDAGPLTKTLAAQCRKGKTASCVSVWALNGAHVCSRSQLSPERFRKGLQALEQACRQGWDNDICDGPLPERISR